MITSLNNAITLTKRLREIGKNIGDAEFNNLLADLSLEIADTKLTLANVTEENANLKSELTKLKHSQGVTKPDLFFREFAYFTEENDGPFCPGCYDAKNLKIRLKKEKEAFSDFGNNSCPSCREVFG